MQGFATGAAAASIGAALVDLDPAKGSATNSIAPLAGMAIGALGTSALVQYAPAPTLLVYAVVLVLLVVQAALIWTTPETTHRRAGLHRLAEARGGYPAAGPPDTLGTDTDQCRGLGARRLLSLAGSIIDQRHYRQHRAPCRGLSRRRTDESVVLLPCFYCAKNLRQPH